MYYEIHVHLVFVMMMVTCVLCREFRKHCYLSFKPPNQEEICPLPSAPFIEFNIISP